MGEMLGWSAGFRGRDNLEDVDIEGCMMFGGTVWTQFIRLRMVTIGGLL
jgi:hypothetical protein